MHLKLPEVGYKNGQQPLPFGVASYHTISTDLCVSYDFHMHIFVEQFHLKINVMWLIKIIVMPQTLRCRALDRCVPRELCMACLQGT